MKKNNLTSILAASMMFGSAELPMGFNKKKDTSTEEERWEQFKKDNPIKPMRSPCAKG